MRMCAHLFPLLCLVCVHLCVSVLSSFLPILNSTCSLLCYVNASTLKKNKEQRCHFLALPLFNSTTRMRLSL